MCSATPKAARNCVRSPAGGEGRAGRDLGSALAIAADSREIHRARSNRAAELERHRRSNREPAAVPTAPVGFAAGGLGVRPYESAASRPVGDGTGVALPGIMPATIFTFNRRSFSAGPSAQVAAMLPQLQKQGVAVTALVGPGRTIVDWLRAAGVKDILHSPSFPREHSNARGLAWLKRSREFLGQAPVVGHEVEAAIGGPRHRCGRRQRCPSRGCRRRPLPAAKRVPIVWRAGGMEL